MAEPTKEELLARITELEKQVATKKAGMLEFKVSEKGGVSVYGLGRFPVTLTPNSGRNCWTPRPSCGHL
jgi:hypothetical protein